MILRTERHRELLLASLHACNYPGAIVHEIVELKAEILTAKIEAVVPLDHHNGDARPPMDATEVRLGDRTGA